MRFIITIILCIVLSPCLAQYIYFDNSYQVDGLEEYFSDVFVTDSNYITASVRNSDSSFQVIREYNLQGEVLNEKYIAPSSSGFYVLGGFEQTLNSAPGDDNLFMCGAASTGNDFEGYLVKYSPQLDTLWTKAFYIFEQGTTLFTYFYATETNLYVTAYSVDLSEFPYKGGTALVNLDLDGNLIWSKPIKPFEPAFMYRDRSVKKVEDGFLIGGFKRFVPPPDEGQVEYTATVSKTDLEGELQWEYESPWDGFYEGYAQIVVWPNNESVSFTTKGYQVWEMYPTLDYLWSKIVIRKHNPLTGEVIEEREYLENFDMLHGGCHKAIPTPDGGMLLAGDKHTVDEDFQLYTWLLKLDANGDEEWYNEYFHQGYEFFEENNMSQEFYDLEIAPDGGYIVAGSIDHQFGQNEISWLLKLDQCGDVIDDGCPVVGIEEIETDYKSLAVWPNPTNDILHFESNKGEVIISWVIRNNGGTVVMKSDNSYYGELVVDLSQMASGMYFLETFYKNGDRDIMKVILN